MQHAKRPPTTRLNRHDTGVEGERCHHKCWPALILKMSVLACSRKNPSKLASSSRPKDTSSFARSLAFPLALPCIQTLIIAVGLSFLSRSERGAALSPGGVRVCTQEKKEKGTKDDSIREGSLRHLQAKGQETKGERKGVRRLVRLPNMSMGRW